MFLRRKQEQGKMGYCDDANFKFHEGIIMRKKNNKRKNEENIFI